MIGLRRTIDRALGHRWLGPLIMIVLVVMLVFVMLHTTIDAAHGELGMVCLAIVAAFLRLLVRPRRRVDWRRVLTGASRRGPPIGALSLALTAAPRPNPPLRL